MKKSVLRESFLKKRLSLSKEDIAKAENETTSFLAGEKAFIKAEKIALYYPFRNEVPTGKIESLANDAGKIICLPRTLKEENKLVFAVHGGKLINGPYGIMEPDDNAQVLELSELDMIVVPGLAFDHQGFRLGYGKGYYDRVLGSRKRGAIIVGLAYSFQVVEELPGEPHDMKVDMIAAETGVIHISAKGV